MLERISRCLIAIIISSKYGNRNITRREQHTTLFDEVYGSGWFSNFTGNFTSIWNTIFLYIHGPFDNWTGRLISDSTCLKSIVEPFHTSLIVCCIERVAANIITRSEVRCTNRFRRWRNNKRLRSCTVRTNTSSCLTETIGTISVSDLDGTFDRGIDGRKLVRI